MEQNGQKLHPVLSVRVFGADKCFGPGVATLLHRVDELHSLRAAAASIGMAYSKAWTIIKRAEAVLGFPLLSSTTGGRNGGGATLTPQAAALLRAYESYCDALHALADPLFEKHFAEFL